MAWVATAVVGTSLVTGYMGSQAAGKAADAQRDAANNAAGVQKYIYDQGREDMQPWRNYGINALDRLNGNAQGYTQNEDRRKFLQDKIKTVQGNQEYWKNVLNGSIGANGNREGWQGDLNTSNKEFDQYTKELAGLKDFGPGLSGAELGNSIMQEDPGYQFRLNQGNKAINAAASARGMSIGGRTLKELANYGQDYASNEYGNAYNRLAAQAGVGQAATNNMANLGQQYAQQYGQTQSAIGNANAAGQIGQANAISGAFNNGMNGYMMANYLKK